MVKLTHNNGDHDDDGEADNDDGKADEDDNDGELVKHVFIKHRTLSMVYGR